MNNISFGRSTNKRNSLGMSEMVYTKLLEKLDSINANSADGQAKRIYTRLEYFDPFFELILEKSKLAHRRRITVAARNISRGGISVLHSSFIYPGTKITAKLHKADGEPFKTTGEVCRCEHRGGVVHEIGIQFDQAITVQEFVRPDIIDAIKSYENVDPTSLKGKVLFVGSDPAINPFVREYLLDTNINFGFTEAAEEALHLEHDSYDLIFVCSEAGTMSGPEFIRCLRDCGYKNPIVLSGKVNNDQEKQTVRLSTADMFLPVPITQNSLMCALAEYLLTQWSEKTLEIIRTGVDVNTVDILQQELASLGASIDSYLESENSVEIYIICTKIRNISLILGMKALHTHTFTVCEEIAQTGDLKKFENELINIKLICSNSQRAA